MDFFGAIFSSLAAFFGIGNTTSLPPVPPPEPVIEAIEAPTSPQEAIQIDQTVTQELESGNRVGETPQQFVEADTETMTGEAAQPKQPTRNEPAPVVLEPDIKTMLVAGGCFWCVEADMEKTKGVISAVSGYAGGDTENPTYQDYGKGGHREVVLVTYDANQVSYEDILIVALKTTDPTDDDGTFGDRGDKYSSAFYYETDEQKQIIEQLIKEVDEFGPYEDPLAIDVEPRPTFWPAEDYHQDYYKGALTQVKYQLYRTASGRTVFIEKHWGINDHSSELPWRTSDQSNSINQGKYMWASYIKPSKEELKSQLSDIEFKVTQEDGTERAGTSDLDKNYEPGIYVDILSGEPLYSSRDKFDSGTGWPSFTKPITPEALTYHEDRKLFTVRTETRSAIADNHLGHVFDDGPRELGGKRYCMNGAALKFVALADMEAEGYGDFIQYVK